MKKRTSYLIVGIIIVVGLVIDLVTKVIFAQVLENGARDIDVIPGVFRFIYIENDGAAYGMLGGHTWLLIILTIAFIIGFICYYIFNYSSSIWYSLSIGLIISGAIGNLVDRVFIGKVRDFLSLEFFNFIFNFADVWITLGVICFSIHMLIEIIKEVREKKGKKSENDASDK